MIIFVSLLLVCHFHFPLIGLTITNILNKGTLIGPKWNWMSYNNERWSTAVCCAKMFCPSLFQSSYGGNILLPSFPVWWDINNGKELDRLNGVNMLKHFIDPTLHQVANIYENMKTTIYFPRFSAVVKKEGGKPDYMGNRTPREFLGMPILNSFSVGQPVTKPSKTTIKTSDKNAFLDFKHMLHAPMPIRMTTDCWNLWFH